MAWVDSTSGPLIAMPARSRTDAVRAVGADHEYRARTRAIAPVARFAQHHRRHDGSSCSSRSLGTEPHGREPGSREVVEQQRLEVVLRRGSRDRSG